ncbi:hypothetical protein IFM12275_23740 [Nocardia sputorum]|uniref:cysteine hydrolase family protein n=1 Tax=Nocardia sputorum TaxID=2984338 RepID=UPI002492496A|nr:isochorismatase family protein [Nocardia sputorum]BDT92398.1 hypothetical protein IFM12275_23740 [Nocardia sputorum]
MISWGIELEPDRIGLLLLDPRDVLLQGLLPISDNHRIVGRLNVLAHLCRHRDIPVITTSRTVCPDRGLRVEPGDIRLPEPRTGAFSGADLDRVMRAFGLGTVIIGGFGMKACYEAVGRIAADRGHRVIFLADGAAGCTIMPDGIGWGAQTPSSKAGHTTLSPLNMPFAEMTTCVDLARRLTTWPRKVPRHHEACVPVGEKREAMCPRDNAGAAAEAGNRAGQADLTIDSSRRPDGGPEHWAGHSG